MEEGPINHWTFKYDGFILHISCIVFSTKCYSLCMYTLKIIFQFSMVAYSIFVWFCHPSNDFVNIKLACIIAINGWIFTSTIFWLDIWLSGTFLSSYRHYKCHFIFQKCILIFLFIVMPCPLQQVSIYTVCSCRSDGPFI
jgi:hypothetical protein